MSSSSPPRAKVFVSFSHKDDKYRMQLESQLTLLQRKGYVDWWTDMRLLPGTEWEAEILRRLDEADIILCLVSIHFLASEFCWSKELRRAIERHRAGSARVIPVFVRVCQFQETPIELLQGVPHSSKPIFKWADRHQAWAEVAKGIQKVVQDWRECGCGVV